MWIVILVLALVVIFLSVIVLRALAFKPKPEPAPDPSEVSFDADGAVQALAALVRCRTVSRDDPAEEDDAEFDKLTGLLPTLYPNVAQTCPL